jgi:hypothetical protein
MIDTTTLPRELRSQVELELQPGERVVWMDQPIPARLARASLGLVIFGVPWTAFAVFWTGAAATGVFSAKPSGAGKLFWLFPLFGLPFILIGVGLLSSPWWMRKRAARTAYVITDRRAILFEGGWRGSLNVRSFEPAALRGELQRKQHADGSGDLVFVQNHYRDSDGDRRVTRVGFFAVRDVKGVEGLIRALAQKPDAHP